MKSGIPPIIEGIEIISKSCDKANIFNCHFALKSKLPKNLPMLPPFQYLTNKTLSEISTNELEVKCIITELNPNKANGPDTISNKVLKIVKDEISPILASIFNQSLSSGEFPNEWKEAHVSPIHKSNDHQNKSNYRPISLLSNLGKIKDLKESTNIAQQMNFSHGETQVISN